MFSTPPASLNTQILYIHSYTPLITTANRRYVTLFDDAISPDVSCDRSSSRPQSHSNDHVILLPYTGVAKILFMGYTTAYCFQTLNSPPSSLTMISIYSLMQIKWRWCTHFEIDLFVKRIVFLSSHINLQLPIQLHA